MRYDRPSRRSLGHTIQGRPYIGTGRQKLVRSAGRRRNAVLGFERLEDRTVLATLIEARTRHPLTLTWPPAMPWPSWLTDQHLHALEPDFTALGASQHGRHQRVRDRHGDADRPRIGITPTRRPSTSPIQRGQRERR